MKKIYKIEVDCAVCAQKIEAAIKKIEGVNSVQVNFITQKMILDASDSEYALYYHSVKCKLGCNELTSASCFGWRPTCILVYRSNQRKGN